MPAWRTIILEAHRRRVWQVALAYCIGAWAGMRVIVALHHALGLHDWVPTAASVLFLVGLVMVGVTAAINGRAPAPADLIPRSRTAAEPRPEYPLDVPYVGAPSHQPLLREASPLLSWRRSLALGVVAFAFLGAGATVFMGSRHFGVGPGATLIARGLLEEGAQLVLVDFTAEGHGQKDPAARSAAIPVAVTEALRLALLDAHGLRIIEPIRVGRAMARNGHGGPGLTLDDGADVAAVEGASAIVTGTVAARGAGFTLRARVLTADGTRALATLHEQARDTTDLLAAVDRLGRELRSRIGESLRTVRAAPPLSRLATPSVPAFILYAESLRATFDDVATATTLAEAAVALDPSFAMAWRRLGLLLLAQDERHAEMRLALTRAYELRHGMPARERLLAEAEHAHLVIHDEARAIPLYEAVLRSAPYDEGALLGLPHALMQQRRFAEAEPPLAAAVERGIASPRQWLNLVAVRYALGRTDDARVTLARARHILPSDPELRRLEATFAAAEGEWARAELLIRASAGRAPASDALRATTSLDLALAARAQGRLTESLRHLEHADAALARLGGTARRLRLRIAEAEMTVLARLDRVGALRLLEAAEREFPLDSLPAPERPYLQLAEVYAWAGDTGRAQALLDAFEAAGLPPTGDEAAARTRAILELARGDVLAAVASLRAYVSAGACTICGLAELGHALEAAGEPAAALEAYERYLETPHLMRGDSDATWRAFVLGRAAELHRTLGDGDNAARRYDEFATLWQRADYELQAQVESARRWARGLVRQNRRG